MKKENTEEEGYSRGKMAELLGVSPQTVHFWTNSHLIYPNISSSSRAGLHRKYDKINLMECFLIKLLQEDLFSLDRIKRILDSIRFYNVFAKKKKWEDFWESDWDAYYRSFKYSKIQEPKRPGECEDFLPDRDKKGPFVSLESLAYDTYYFQVLNLGIIKKKIFKIIKEIDL